MVRNYNQDSIPTKYNRDTIPDTSERKGVIQKKFRGIDMTIGINTFTPEMEPNPHSHPWEQINYVLEGACDFHVGDETLNVEQGDIFFIPPETLHYAETSGSNCTIFVSGPMREDSNHQVRYQEEFGTLEE